MQIWLNGWDVHSNATGHLPSQCQDVDQACWGLVQDLKARGFSFVGPTIVYAHMQAVGMVNDHTVDCFRHRPLGGSGR